MFNVTQDVTNANEWLKFDFCLVHMRTVTDSLFFLFTKVLKYRSVLAVDFVYGFIDLFLLYCHLSVVLCTGTLNVDSIFGLLDHSLLYCYLSLIMYCIPVGLHYMWT